MMNTTIQENRIPSTRTEVIPLVRKHEVHGTNRAESGRRQFRQQMFLLNSADGHNCVHQLSYFLLIKLIRPAM